MSKLKYLAMFVGLVIAAGQTAPVQAGTPGDTLVMAKNIDDIITLDPAEVFEFTGGEVIANIYDRVMMFEAEDLTTLVGGAAESYTISDDGKTITLKLRPNQKFHSGNMMTAADMAFSLQRVIKLNKTPSFIFTQFGWNADNVDSLVTAPDDSTVVVKLNSDLSPALALNALSAGVGAVIDMKLVMSHEIDGDLGYEWLKNHSAGSGPYSLKTYKANEVVILDYNPDYRKGAPAMKRVILRHIPEASAQRLLIEKGDVDMARDLTPDLIKGLEGNKDVIISDDPKAALIYMAANQAHPILGNPKVNEALRYIVDYEGMVNSFLAGQFKTHQAFWPSGLWASYDKTPFTLDLDKARALLAEGGYPGGGFKIRIDTLTKSPYPEIAQAVQQALSKIGVESEITLAEGKTLWPMYRARKHELILAQWSPDYVDPHSNADAFAHNPDNALEAKLTGKVAWRTSFFSPEINGMTEAAASEADLNKREKIYMKLQKRMQEIGPFTIMFQKSEQTALRSNVTGYVSGANFDLVFYRTIKK